MRTSIDIPDALMAEVRVALAEKGLTFREAVIEGLRRTLLEPTGNEGHELRDASFKGVIGFAAGFEEGALTEGLRDDAETRLVAEDRGRYKS